MSDEDFAWDEDAAIDTFEQENNFEFDGPNENTEEEPAGMGIPSHRRDRYNTRLDQQELPQRTFFDMLFGLALGEGKKPYDWQLQWFDNAYRTFNLAVIPPGCGKTDVAIYWSIAKIFKAYAEGRGSCRLELTPAIVLLAVPYRALATNISETFKKALKMCHLEQLEGTKRPLTPAKFVKVVEGPGASYDIKRAQIIIATYEHAANLLKIEAIRTNVKFVVVDEIHELFGSRGPTVDRVICRALEVATELSSSQTSNNTTVWGLTGSLEESEQDVLLRCYGKVLPKTEIYFQHATKVNTLRKVYWWSRADRMGNQNTNAWFTYVLDNVFSMLWKTLSNWEALVDPPTFKKCLVFWDTVSNSQSFIMALAIKFHFRLQNKSKTITKCLHGILDRVKTVQIGSIITEIQQEGSKKSRELADFLRPFMDDTDVKNFLSRSLQPPELENIFKLFEEFGIYYHNSPMDEDRKKVIEKAAIEGQFLLISATSTLAVGIDVKEVDVVFVPPDRFSLIQKKTAIQMAGRVGRTKEGLAVVCDSPTYHDGLITRGRDLNLLESMSRVIDMVDRFSFNTLGEFMVGIDRIQGFYSIGCGYSLWQYINDLHLNDKNTLRVINKLFEVYPTSWFIDLVLRLFRRQNSPDIVYPLLYFCFCVVSPPNYNNYRPIYTSVQFEANFNNLFDPADKLLKSMKMDGILGNPDWIAPEKPFYSTALLEYVMAAFDHAIAKSRLEKMEQILEGVANILSNLKWPEPKPNANQLSPEDYHSEEILRRQAFVDTLQLIDDFRTMLNQLIFVFSKKNRVNIETFAKFRDRYLVKVYSLKYPDRTPEEILKLVSDNYPLVTFKAYVDENYSRIRNQNNQMIKRTPPAETFRRITEALEGSIRRAVERGSTDYY